MTGRSPLAQPLTLDFNLVTVRNAARGRELLGVSSVATVTALSALVAALSAGLDALRASQTGSVADLDGRLTALESAPPSSGGGGLGGTVEVDFGATEAGMAEAVVSVPGALDGAIVVAALSQEATADHDPEDGLIEGVLVSATPVSGESVTVRAWAPEGTWGRYRVNCVVV